MVLCRHSGGSRNPGSGIDQFRVHINMVSFVFLAKKEFEAWFLAAAESLRGQQGLPLDLTSPHYPENIRGAKE